MQVCKQLTDAFLSLLLGIGFISIDRCVNCVSQPPTSDRSYPARRTSRNRSHHRYQSSITFTLYFWGLIQVVIVGTGAFGQGLASLAIRSGATSSYSISLGTRKMGAGQAGTLPGLEDTPVAALSDTLPTADMVRLV